MNRHVRLLCAVVGIVGGAAPGLARADDVEEPGAHTRGQFEPRRELVSSLSGSRYSITSKVPGSAAVDGLAEHLGFQLTTFFAPLRDDGTPYSLRRFLQRTESISVDVGAGRFATDNPLGFTPRTDWDANVGGSADFYARPWLNVFAGLSYEYDALSDVGLNEKTHSFSGSGGAGWRTGDTLIRASYYAVEQRVSSGSHPSRQGVQLSAFTAIDRRFVVSLFGETIPQGEEGQLFLEYFRRPSLGIFVSALAAKGQLYRTGSAVNRYVGSAGLSYWLNPTTGLSGQYSLTVEERPNGTQLTATDISAPGYQEITHALLLQLFLRFQ